MVFEAVERSTPQWARLVTAFEGIDPTANIYQVGSLNHCDSADNKAQQRESQSMRK